MKRCIVLCVRLYALALCLLAAQVSAEVTVVNAMTRIGLDGAVMGGAAASVSAAKNEWESFQVVVRADEGDVTVTGVVPGDLVSGNGRIDAGNVAVYREEYVRVRRSTRRSDLNPGLYADPLVPLVNPITGEPIEPITATRERWGGPIEIRGFEMFAVPWEIRHGQNQPFWVDIHVPGDAAAGTYRGAVTVTFGGGEKVSVPVTLTVWDFALPDHPTHHNHFGNFGNVTSFFNVERNSDRFRAIEERYCAMFAEHRLTPPIPRHLLPDVNPDGSLQIDTGRTRELQTFIDRYHVADFEIPRAPYRDPVGADRDKAMRYVRGFHQYVKDNGWADGAYYYMHDEPNLSENYEHVLAYGALVEEAAPGLKRLVVEQTYLQDPSWPDMDPSIDIWCPLWAFIDRDTIAEKIAHGDEVWSYTALVQRTPSYHPKYNTYRNYNPPYWHIDRPLGVYRAPLWINRQYGITGILYWTAITRVLDPWNNPVFSHFGLHFNGGGYLLYPGLPCGMDGPIASMRLKTLRDGMEDYEYFALLEKRADTDAVMRIVSEIAPEWWDFSTDPADYDTARRKLAEEIIRAK